MKNKRVRNMVQIGMLAAVATVLMLFEFPLWFAPSFYELDFSEVAVLIGAFSMGPMAGVMIEALKILLNFLINGTITAGVGELANFVIGCSLVLPASVLYCRKKTRKTALIGCIVGTLFITLAGSLVNPFYLLPAFSKLYGMDLDVIIGMGAAIFPKVENFNLYHFVFYCVAPINLIKGAAVSAVILLIYRPLERILQQRF